MKDETVILTNESKLQIRDFLFVLEKRINAYNNEYSTYGKQMPYDSRDCSVDKRVIGILNTIVGES